MKRKDNIGFGDLSLVQDDDGFKFGIDAVILADFASSFYPDAKTIIDLGTGNGIIPLILSHKIPRCKITGFDVQPNVIKLAKENVAHNSLEQQISFVCCDVSDISKNYSMLKASADMVVSNPPYVAKGGGIFNKNKSKLIACQETTAGIEKFISTAAFLLRNKGHFFLIFRPYRLVDVFYFCRKYEVEPKDIRFVSPSEGKTPNIALVHCVHGGGHELKVLDTLFVYDSKGKYTSDILKIYEKQVENISKLCNNML